MTKKDIVKHLQDKIRFITAADATEAVDGVIEAITKSLTAGEDVFLRGFATFKVKELKEKKARNILKGKEVIVPAHKTVRLVLSEYLKAAINS